MPEPEVFQLPAIDTVYELARSRYRHKVGEPLRFANPVAVEISTKTHGQWTDVADGRVWRLRFDSPGATDLNFGFGEFVLPEGASLHFVPRHNGLNAYFDGPYTSADNHSHREFWSAPLPGGETILELFVPKSHQGPFQFHLKQVGIGFRDVFRLSGGPGLTKQDACNNDVVCPEGDPWRDQIRAVAAYTVAGIDTCSGTMVIDADRTFTPYFLTAYHCGVSSTNAASVVTIWNYESPNCGDLGGGSRLDTVSGTIFRARRQDVDMALLELSSPPPASYGVYWAGWDRTDLAPTGSVGIHHPGVEEKAISFNLDPLTFRDSCIGGGGTNTHWNVDNWEDGTTERGSSGSGLFNPDNKALIGFLSGGLASCSVLDLDCYGRFGVAWSGGSSNAERLAPWLDPSGTGLMTASGAYPGGSTTGPEVCSAPDSAIPDDDPAGLNDVLVTAAEGALVDLDLGLRIDHTWVGDLVVTLTHLDTGTSAVLIDRPGFTGLGFGCGGDNIDATLDDEAGAAAESTCDNDPALGGRLTPNAPLSVFDGEALAGQWQLTVSDLVAVDAGTLRQWCLVPTLPIFADGFEE